MACDALPVLAAWHGVLSCAPLLIGHQFAVADEPAPLSVAQRIMARMPDRYNAPDDFDAWASAGWSHDDMNKSKLSAGD